MIPPTRRHTARLSLLLILLGWVLLAFPRAALAGRAGSDAGRRQTGQGLYHAACANCHGAGGRGAPASLVAFDVPLPDFSDCSFATREPDADWVSVAHQGGPTRGFSRLMPAFGEVLSVEELQKVMEHVRGFCPDKNWPRGELNLPRPLITGKAYPEDEAVFTSAVTTEGPDSIDNEVIYERRFGARNQFELVVPLGWRQMEPAGDPGGEMDWTSSVGDVALGLKRALYHNLERGSIFSVAGEVIFPTGDEDRGFGKGTVIFEPFAVYGQILPAEFFLHGQAGLEIPMDGDRAEDEAFLRLALGRSFTSGGPWGRAWAPMLEILGGRELVSGAEDKWDLVPQMQVTLSTRQHVRMNLGVRTPLTDREERETTVILYLLWDWFDGGLLEGW